MMLKKIMITISCIGLAVTSGAWLAQSGQPLTLHNGFSSRHFSFSSDGSVWETEALPRGVIAKGQDQEGHQAVAVLGITPDVLPPLGSHSLVELRDGDVVHAAGRVEETNLPAYPSYAARRLVIEEEHVLPLWPVLLAFTLWSSYYLLRTIFARQRQMLDGFRTYKPRTVPLLFTYAMLLSLLGVSLANSLDPVFLVNGFATEAPVFTLDDEMEWQLSPRAEPDRMVLRHNQSKKHVIMGVEPSHASTALPSLGEHWLVAAGQGWLFVKSGVISHAVIKDFPEYESRKCTDYVTHFAVPLWPIMALMTALFGTLAVMPSTRYYQRRMRNQCIKCGADVRGRVDRCSACHHTLESRDTDIA